MKIQYSKLKIECTAWEATAVLAVVLSLLLGSLLLFGVWFGPMIQSHLASR